MGERCPVGKYTQKKAAGEKIINKQEVNVTTVNFQKSQHYNIIVSTNLPSPLFITGG